MKTVIGPIASIDLKPGYTMTPIEILSVSFMDDYHLWVGLAVCSGALADFDGTSQLAMLRSSVSLVVYSQPAGTLHDQVSRGGGFWPQAAPANC